MLDDWNALSLLWERVEHPSQRPQIRGQSSLGLADLVTRHIPWSGNSPHFLRYRGPVIVDGFYLDESVTGLGMFVDVKRSDQRRNLL